MNFFSKVSILMTTAFLLALNSFTVSAGLFGSSNSSWSNEDKRNFCYFLNSQRSDGHATNISNSAGKNATQEQVSQLLYYWRHALNEASQVTDSVLDKINPELKIKYKNQYIIGLQYQIAAFEQQNAQYSITGFNLKSKYKDWFSSAKNRFKIPKGTVAACR